MSAARGYRIAAFLLVLFAVLHTVGFLGFKPPTPEAAAVRDAMDNVHFEGYTYGNFYRGLGLSVTVCLLFTAFLAWHLATHPNPAIGWGLCAVEVAGLVVALMYIGAPPAIFSSVVGALLAWSTWRSQTVTRS